MYNACNVLLITVLSVVACFAADPEPKSGAAVYDDFIEPFRTDLKKRWEARVAQQELAIKKAKTLKEKKVATEVLQELKVNNPPYISYGGMPIWRDERGDRPWVVGDYGECTSSIHVVQILDERQFLASVTFKNNPTVMFKGFNTAKLVDGRTIEIRVPLHVTGTTRYTTAIGTSNTVLVVEPLDILAVTGRPGPPIAPPRSLEEMRDAVIAAKATAQRFMAEKKFTDSEIEYVAKYVNRGPKSVDGTNTKLLEHEPIQAWIKAERAYVTKRDASVRN